MHATSPSLFVAILIACLIVLVLVIFFTATMIRYQRRNLSLYKEKLAAEITTLEKERTRMAEDLHDELGPVLVGIKLKLNSLDRLDQQDQAMLDKVHLDIAGLINRMKDISNDLMPVVLIKKGLARALENAADEINHNGGLHVLFSTGKLPELPSPVAVNLYRICQEIMTNTIKHAQANELTIHLQQMEGKLVVTTVDDGKGFDHRHSSSQGRGYGLVNLHNRTEMLGGEMYVDSSPGNGTKYRIEIPI
jgi:two-component system NarL family sensor kinase